MVFWVTCKIAQPIQPIWQHIFALPWSALKKPPWEFNFLHIFRIPSSSRHEKCCQLLQTLFWVFQYSRNSHCIHLISAQTKEGTKCIKAKERLRAYCHDMYIYWDFWEFLWDFVLGIGFQIPIGEGRLFLPFFFFFSFLNSS